MCNGKELAEPRVIKDKPLPSFSRSLEQALHRALALAGERRHEYATLEHLLLALIDDQDAAAVMRACNVDLDGFSLLRHYLKNEEHLLRYMLSQLKREASGYYSPFPCIYHDKQMQWSDYGGKLSSQMLNDIPSLEGLKKLLAGGYLQENSALPVDVVCTNMCHHFISSL